MFFGGNEQLEEKIVYSLGKKPSQDAAALLSSVNASGKMYSIQALYKELRKLEHQGVVVKLKRTYSLRLPWIAFLSDFSSVVEENYISKPMLKSLLPKPGGKLSWQFTSLIKLNNVWAQLLLALLQEVGPTVLYDYTPHPWYHLAQVEAEDQFVKSFIAQGGKMAIAMGGKTFLDQWTTKFWQQPAIEFSHAPAFFQDAESEINCMGDYVITVKLGKQTLAAIRELYNTTLTLSDREIPRVIELFNSPQRGKLTIEHNKQKALKIQKKFNRFFGI